MGFQPSTVTSLGDIQSSQVESKVGFKLYTWMAGEGMIRYDLDVTFWGGCWLVVSGCFFEQELLSRFLFRFPSWEAQNQL